MEDKRPRFLQKGRFVNGRVEESHAPASMIFRICDPCSEESGEQEEREYQLVSTDPGREISVFRCVICNNRIEVKNKELIS